ncbi:MAG: hypothetical protein CM15mP59_2780 [Flavobacteriaceae bacterium]|nr:MAG: hypothetical protein CM15mP59_2780 [Flavobacteriaceae bacterium]
MAAKVGGYGSAKKPKKVVDVATGTGDLALALTSISDATITGIDISVEMLEIGKQKVNQNKLDYRIKMVVGDAESLPLQMHLSML